MQERRTLTALNEEIAPPAPAPGRQRQRLEPVAARLGVAVAVAGLVVAVDQVTKQLAADRLAGRTVHVIGPLDLTLEHNTGSAFSMFQGHAAVLAVIAAVLVGLLVWAVVRSSSPGRVVALGAIIGGATGNVVDRLVRGDHGAVIDFIELHFWPTFNVADASIVLGCVALAFSLFRDRPGERSAPR